VTSKREKKLFDTCYCKLNGQPSAVGGHHGQRSTVNEQMRVLLISANTERINLPTFPLGLACVAQATMDQGHEVEWLDLMAEAERERKRVLTGRIVA